MAQSILGDDAKAAQLSQLLVTLQDPNNVQRTQAEEALNTQWVDAQPDALLVGLAEQVQRASDPAVCVQDDLSGLIMPNVICSVDAVLCCCSISSHVEPKQENKNRRQRRSDR